MNQNRAMSHFLAQDHINCMIDEANNNRLARGQSDDEIGREALTTRLMAGLTHALRVALNGAIAVGRRAFRVGTTDHATVQ